MITIKVTTNFVLVTTSSICDTYYKFYLIKKNSPIINQENWRYYMLSRHIQNIVANEIQELVANATKAPKNVHKGYLVV